MLMARLCQPLHKNGKGKMAVRRKNDNLSAMQAHARAAVKNVRKKWPKAIDQDAEEIESKLTQELTQREVRDPIGWGTRYADRAFGKLFRRAATEMKHAARVASALKRKAESEPVRRGRPKSKRYDRLDLLKAALNAECREEFRRFAGKDWETPVEQLARAREARHATERDARRRFNDLRAAMLSCSEFATNVRNGTDPHRGTTAIFLGWWVERFIDPLLKHAALDAERDFDDLLDEFALFVKRWDDYDFLHLKPAGQYASAFLSDRQLAVVSLLGGFFPPSIERDATRVGKLRQAIGTGRILELQTAAIRTARRRHGRLRDAIDKAVGGVAPMPKNARYVVRQCDPSLPKVVHVGQPEPFRTMEEARHHCDERWPGSSVAQMDHRSWFIWSANKLVATIDLMEFLRNTRQRRPVRA